MIEFVYGNHGTGKTEYILRCLETAAKEGREALLIVPEQMTVAAERTVAERLPPSAQLKIEVLNFTRLCDRVFRKTGGLVRERAGEGVRRVLMQRALKAVGPLLSEYREAALSDAFLPRKMLSVCDELESCGISPDLADSASAALPAGSTQRKLRDIAAVYASYRALLETRFSEPADDLRRLCALDNPAEIFGQTDIFLDAFSGLTGVQHKIVRMLMQSARSVTVAVPLPEPSFRGSDTESLHRMSKRLRSDAAETSRPVKTVLLTEAHRYTTEALRAISADLWTPGAAAISGDPGDSVRLIAASDAYDEAEACAAEIRRLVRENGYRFRDVAVIARNADALRGIIDRALEDADVRWFLSEKTPLSSCAPARLLLSALRILTGGWQREDVIAHLKTGLCGISPEDTDLFEIYTQTWKISGRRFLSGDWDMNPDGYREELTPRGKAVLTAVNGVRAHIADTLGVLEENIRAAATCDEICAALYRYTEELGIRGAMRERAEAEAAAGRIREARECTVVTDAVIGALEQTADAYRDAEVPGTEEFCSALRTVLDACSVGSIPVSGDAVTVGSADRMRADAPRCVILLGVTDGVFPAVPADGSLFSPHERESLKEVLPLLRDSETAASDELYYLRRAAASASEKLIVFTRRDAPSVAVSRIRTLLPDLAVLPSDDDIPGRITTLRLAEEYRNLLHGSPEAAALASLLETFRAETGSPDPALHPVGSANLSLPSETAAAAAGNAMILSQTRLEDFVACPFRYFCKYTLGLSPEANADFSHATAGTFLHAVLEHYLREIFVSRKGVFPEGEEREALLDDIVKSALNRLAPEGSGQRTARLEHLSRRLHALADVITSDLLEELKDSDFIPAAFELRIGRNGIPPLRFAMKDGSTVSVEGIIDRVDVFRDGDTAYLRTVDYKTGAKTFRLEDIDHGENLQLLLYLFTLTRGEGSLPAVGDAHPAEGAFTYLLANLPRVEEKTGNAAAIRESAAESISRKGALLDSDRVRSAVSHTGNDRYLMGKERYRNQLSGEQFSALYEKVADILVGTAEKIRGGTVAADPAKGPESCKICDYAGVCRSARRN